MSKKTALKKTADSMGLFENILMLFCRDPKAGDYHISDDDASVENAFSLMDKEFGQQFNRDIEKGRVLDFGCSIGRQSVQLAVRGAEKVVGFDIRDNLVFRARELARKHGVQSTVTFINTTKNDFNASDFKDYFDIIISQNSFEHYDNPENILTLFVYFLKKRGKAYVTFSTPWYHPHGGHLNYFTKLPWAHLLFPESSVMKVRKLYRDDGATRYEEVEGGLNRMTLARFRKIIKASGLEIEFWKLNAIKGFNFLCRLPILNEFVTNRISCILRK